jgi:hypothetical protein
MTSPAPRLLAGLALIAAAACALTARGQDGSRQNKRSEFMRQKLEYSKNVLEGLAREDFALVADGARKLRRLSMAAEWEVPVIPNAEQYIVYTADFQRICDDLAKKARDRNLDGATLAFNRMTVNCVECHRYVRAITK